MGGLICTPQAEMMQIEYNSALKGTEKAHGSITVVGNGNVDYRTFADAVGLVRGRRRGASFDPIA
jgi:hypothetical protein